MKTIHATLERKLSDFLGLKHAVLFSSCRNALYTLLLSLELRKGDEVIIQSFICDSLPQAIEKAGGKVVSVEVNSATFNLDVKTVEEKLTKNTRAVVFVHTYGNPSGIQEVAELCQRKKIILIEDIAHALGASFNGKPAGSFGDYAVYSFTKQMVNIGGGAVITNNDVMKIRELRNALHKPASFLGYLKRLMASLYETRAFFVSKILIDIARRNANLKMVNSLDRNFRCSSLEAYLALRQVKAIHKAILKRSGNYLFLKDHVSTQQLEKEALSSHNYLSLLFDQQEQRDCAISKNFLFLPSWSGSKISEKLIFIPNNPSFSKRRLDTFINSYLQAASRNSPEKSHGKSHGK